LEYCFTIEGSRDVIDMVLFVSTQIGMPRKARIDIAGALHHIIMRRIERSQIFYDDVDRDALVNRPSQVLI